ncbi:hypothetical protein ACXJJ3_07580 [Kribbella sp. WER1]
MSKFLGFLLGVAVALAGPAVFGVLAAPGGIELNAKEMALAFGLAALIFWAVVSGFSGAGALGAFAAFGTLVYCWLWIPNRTTNFLDGVPGVTNGMIDGSKQYTLNGVVPILGVISLVYSVQLIVRGVQRRKRERVEAERLQREQEAAQAQQEADVAAVYPVAGGTYQEPVPYQPHSSYDDLFDEPEAAQPRNQADEQTRQFPVGAAEGYEQTRQFPAADAGSNQSDEETVVAAAPGAARQEPVAEAEHKPVAEAEQEPAAEPARAVAEEPKAEQHEAAAEQAGPAAEQAASAASAETAQPVAPVVEEPKVAPADEVTQVAEVKEPTAEAQQEKVEEPAAEQEAAQAQAQAPAPVEAEAAGQAAAAGQAVTGQAAAGQATAGQAAAGHVVGGPGAVEPEAGQAAGAAQQTASDAESAAESAAGSAAGVAAGAGNAPVGDVGKADGGPKAERVVAPVVRPKEEMGSQYRERMEDPEDTGEFFLQAFEKPVVKPA